MKAAAYFAHTTSLLSSFVVRIWQNTAAGIRPRAAIVHYFTLCPHERYFMTIFFFGRSAVLVYLNACLPLTHSLTSLATKIIILAFRSRILKMRLSFERSWLRGIPNKFLLGALLPFLSIGISNKFGRQGRDFLISTPFLC